MNAAWKPIAGSHIVTGTTIPVDGGYSSQG
jgi:hypothetical protein